MPTLSLNITAASREFAIIDLRDVVTTLAEAGMEPGMHSMVKVSDTVFSVRVPVKTASVHGPQISQVMSNLGFMSNVDAIKFI